MTIIIDKLAYSNREAICIFHDDVENEQRTAALTWDNVLLITSVADLKAKLDAIRHKMMFIEGQAGVKIKEERTINGLNYSV